MLSGCPGAGRFARPYPENVKCPVCGADVEIWTDEVHAECQKCRTIVARASVQSCLDWCAKAKECVGEKVFKRYKTNKKKQG